MDDPIADVIGYHHASKHRFQRPAAGPEHLDWKNQPNPFRRYIGAPVIALARVPPTEEPPFEPVFVEGRVAPAPLNRRSVSQLLFDALAISAWKCLDRGCWALRVNPSSGNLHPTEGYLLCGSVEGLCERPMVAHYAPREHALERRAELSDALWEHLSRQLPAGSVLLGLTSVHWREAWKYGERAYRYCQHDVGHALGAVAVAAAALGWRVRLLDGWGTVELAALLGVADAGRTEAEVPDCLLAIVPGTAPPELHGAGAPGETPVVERWLGRPNRLSAERVRWPRLEEVERACRKPPTGGRYPGPRPALAPLAVGGASFGVRPLVHRRRSAVDMDGRSAITRDAFYQILRKCLPGPAQVPFTALPWRPQVHLALFVHRVQGLDPGLYLLLRDPEAEAALRAALAPTFVWQPPEDACPAGLPLYRLRTGDARELAQQLSCGQAIAADGCFTAAMLVRFEPALREHGAWFYPRLFWECGLIGQQLYLEAYASGVAATGIGCYFDDPTHDVLGLRGLGFQVLYHFAVGAAVEDPRLTTLPPYPGPEGTAG